MTEPTTDLPQPLQRAIVLDTAALIAGTDTLYSLGGLTDPQTQHLQQHTPPTAVRFYVTPDVATEVRDPQARARLAALDRLGVIEQKVPSAEAVAHVATFAKATGDYAVLSMTDLRVIALCWMLEVERNGTKYLKQQPMGGGVTEIRKARGIPFEELEKIEQELREKEEQAKEEDDGWTVVQRVVVREDVHGGKKKKKKGKKKPRNGAAQDEKEEGLNGIEEQLDVEGDNHQCVEQEREISASQLDEQPYEVVEELHVVPTETLAAEAHFTAKAEQPDVDQTELSQICAEIENTTIQIVQAPELEGHLSGDDNDDDDDGQGWINEDNVEEHLARDRGAEDMQNEDLNRVACVTTDFAMQNTMLQMGLKILSVDGRRTIRQIKHFALRCQSCGEVTRELQRKFCDKCGNATLHRVAFKVNKKGVARAFVNPKKKPILRGTKYSIPLPRGGRHNKDLILCEDQIDPVKQRRLQKQRERLNVDVLDPSKFYNAGARFNPHDRPLVVGYGRRNPNEVRASGKGKKKR